MSSPKVMTIFTPEGESKKWKALAGRVPEFLAEYPVKEGWRHERQVLEACALTPHLVELHKAAIVAGRNPSDVGLPQLPRGLVFIDRLVDPNGNLVASGSATSPAEALFLPIGQYRSKDYEAGESAAFQRLLAVLGFAGEVFDEDEANTIRSTGSRIVESLPDDIPDDPTARDGQSRDKAKPGDSVVAFRRSAAPAAEPEDGEEGLPPVENPEQALAGVGVVGESEVDAEPDEGSVETGATSAAASDVTRGDVGVTDDKAKPEGSASAPTTAVATPSTSASTVKTTGKGRTAGDAQVLAGFNRVIKLLAKQAGVEEEPATTIDDAKAKQAKLMGLLKH